MQNFPVSRVLHSPYGRTASLPIPADRAERVQKYGHLSEISLSRIGKWLAAMYSMIRSSLSDDKFVSAPFVLTIMLPPYPKRVTGPPVSTFGLIITQNHTSGYREFQLSDFRFLRRKIRFSTVLFCPHCRFFCAVNPIDRCVERW